MVIGQAQQRCTLPVNIKSKRNLKQTYSELQEVRPEEVLAPGGRPLHPGQFHLHLPALPHQRGQRGDPGHLLLSPSHGQLLRVGEPAGDHSGDTASNN